MHLSFIDMSSRYGTVQFINVVSGTEMHFTAQFEFAFSETDASTESPAKGYALSTDQLQLSNCSMPSLIKNFVYNHIGEYYAY